MAFLHICTIKLDSKRLSGMSSVEREHSRCGRHSRVPVFRCILTIDRAPCKGWLRQLRSATTSAGSFATTPLEDTDRLESFECIITRERKATSVGVWQVSGMTIKIVVFFSVVTKLYMFEVVYHFRRTEHDKNSRILVQTRAVFIVFDGQSPPSRLHLYSMLGAKEYETAEQRAAFKGMWAPPHKDRQCGSQVASNGH